jgi:O-antigen/teichoic acid export membrane protein
MVVKRILSTLFVRASVAFINLLVLLLSARLLGSTIVGQISLIILNISLVQILNEIYTGSALVHFIPKLNLKKVYAGGFLWTFGSVLILNLFFYLFGIGDSNYALHSAVLSLLLILHSFHMVILLAKEKIRLYNSLYLLQALLLLIVLLVLVYWKGDRKLQSYLIALYSAYGFSLLCSSLAIWELLKSPEKNTEYRFSSLISKGITNQLGNLAHTLSNRFNYYVIGASAWLGVYANSSSLIESLWIVSGSAAPIVLSHVANRQEEEKNPSMVLYIAKICFAISLACVFVLYFIPNAWFVELLGKDFTETKSLMLYLSPGVLAISFSTIISHYFSGLGQQRVQLMANLAGLLCTLCLSVYLIGSYRLKGACLTASIAYAVQALILFLVFLKQKRFTRRELFGLTH